ncbi:probable serine/threonine-protein kinase STY8 [Coccomyxa sp. Obi]|nr:probable serine/threonine-protein kinase STY8 [Coccomyxa sp. Obi]
MDECTAKALTVHHAWMIPEDSEHCCAAVLARGPGHTSNRMFDCNRQLGADSPARSASSGLLPSDSTPVRPRERVVAVVDNTSRQKELRELAELRMERLQQNFRLLYKEKQLTAAQSALAAAEESAARSSALAQRHLEALHTLPVLPQSALTEAREEIGVGGCGTVSVQSLSLAFKRPRVTGDPIKDDVFYRTFVVEAALMAELRHSHLLQCVAVIHDDTGKLAAFGMPRGRHDLWTEFKSYRDGEARPFGPFPVPRMKKIGLAVVSALRYLHFTAGIIHHDIKLGNILAMKDGTIKVADFGLAARLDSDGFSAEMGAYRGTAGESTHPYSTLHKWRPGPHDDLWGLAVMLAEMITGRALANELCKKLDQLIADYDSGRDKAGLESLDLECCAYGILCPNRNQRLAALQAQWDFQFASSAAALDSLEDALHKITDPVIHPGLGRQAPDVSSATAAEPKARGKRPLPMPIPLPDVSSGSADGGGAVAAAAAERAHPLPAPLPIMVLPGLFPVVADDDAAAGRPDAAAAPVAGAGDPEGRPADSARFLHGAAELRPPVLQRPQPRWQWPQRPQPRILCRC